jgi:hypothetical protein
LGKSAGKEPGYHQPERFDAAEKGALLDFGDRIGRVAPKGDDYDSTLTED